MAVTQHARELPSIKRLFPDIREAGGSIQCLRAVGAVLIEAMGSNLKRSVAGHWEDLNALLIERSAVLRAFDAALLESVHIPVVTREAGCVMEKLQIRSKIATETNGVAGVVGVEEL